MADNYINVTVTSKQNKRVTVSTQDPGYEVTATTDTGKFWAKTAEKWATSDTIVENTDYSSKYYANKAKTSAENAKVYENAVKDTYNTFIAESNNIANEVRNAGQESVNSIESSRLNAVDSINTVKDESIATVENKANEALTLVNNGITQINTTKNTAVDSINATKTNILKDIEFVAEGEKEEIQELAEKAKDDIESTGFYMRDDKLYFINSEGQEEEFKSGDINNKITNCLLEVPQNIKLELVDGALTLKAGSKVYNGDGTVYTRSTDYTVTPSWGTGNGIFVFPLVVDSQIIGFDAISRNLVFSGDVAPTFSGDYAYWFDTTVKRVKYTNNAGASWSEDRALPLCLVSTNNSVITSIDQVFNGFGYIGSTVWVDKGVKGLIPNGRNEDGTLKNIEVVTTKVTTHTNTANSPLPNSFIINSAGSVEQRTYLGEFATAPTPSGHWGMYYNTTEQIFYYNGAGTWVKQYGCIAGIMSSSSTGITSFQPKQPFRAVDYNDKQEIISWGMPDWSSAISATGAYTASNKFVAPCDGYLIYGYWGTAKGALYVNDIVIGGVFGTSAGQGMAYPLTLLLKKGDTFYQQYANNASFPSEHNRFIPLKGAK